MWTSIIGTNVISMRARPSTDTGQPFLYGYSEKPPFTEDTAPTRGHPLYTVIPRNRPI